MPVRLSQTRGLDAFLALFRSAPEAARAAARDALSAAAEDAAAEARARLAERPGHHSETAASVTTGVDDHGAHLTLDGPDARAIEFGSLAAQGHPILRPAAERAAAAGRSALAAAIRKTVMGTPR